MKKNQKKLYISIFFIIFFAIFIFSFVSIHKTEKKLTNPIITTPIPSLIKEGWNAETGRGGESTVLKKEIGSVAVSAGDIKIYLQPNITFYDALVKAKNENEITFSGKNYPRLGFFVTEIGTLRAGSGKNLLYYINGKEATVGVSSYTLKDGDVIEWKLE